MRALGFDVKKADVIKLVHDVDPNNSGNVEYEQFLEIMGDRYSQRDPEEEIRKAFQLFDGIFKICTLICILLPMLSNSREDDHSGRINLKNMKRVARELGENLSEEELQAMIDEFDRDQDGEKFTEFKTRPIYYVDKYYLRRNFCGRIHVHYEAVYHVLNRHCSQTGGFISTFMHRCSMCCFK